MLKTGTKHRFQQLFLGLLVLFFLVSCSKTDAKARSYSLSDPIESSRSISNNATYQKINNSKTLDINDTIEKCAEVPKELNYTNGLLSPRIYAGVLEPRSFLITNFDPLRKDINSYLEENNINASIYVENLRNGVNFGIHSGRGYFPASLNKLPIAILIMQNIEDGGISFNTTFPIMDYERISSSGTLYLTPEKELTVRDLLEKMLKESDNTAFNVLYHHVDKKELARLLDYYNIKINVDYPDRRVEYINQTDLVTSVSLYNIFSSLYLSTVLNAPDSEYILSLLKDTEFNLKALANLPHNVIIVQKYGEYYLDDTKFFHDCGIIYVGQSRLFYCIMTRDMEAEDAKQAIGYIVNHIYNFVVFTKAELAVYKNQTGLKQVNQR